MESTGKPFKLVTHVFSSQVVLLTGLPGTNLGPCETGDSKKQIMGMASSGDTLPAGICTLENVDVLRTESITFDPWLHSPILSPGVFHRSLLRYPRHVIWHLLHELNDHDSTGSC